MRKFYKVKNYGFSLTRIWRILQNSRLEWEIGFEKYYRKYSWSEFNRERILNKMEPTSLITFRNSFYEPTND